MRIGIRIPVYRRWCDRDAVLAIARDAEALGYDAVFVQDHVVAPVDPALDLTVDGVSGWLDGESGGSRPRTSLRDYYAGDDWWLDPYAVWAFVAAATERVLLGSDVVVVPYRNPLVTAKLLGTIDVLSGGRLLVGTGTGHVAAEFATLGVDYDRRGAIHDEYLRVIGDALTHDEIAFAGEHVAFGPTRTLIRTIQRPRPPIFVGGNGRRSIRRAVELGDGWIPSAVSPEALATGLVEVAAACERAGREEPLRLALSSPSGWKVAVPGTPAGRTPAQSPAEIVDRLGRYGDLGVELAVVGLPMPDLAVYRAQLEAFAAEVLPHLGR